MTMTCGSVSRQASVLVSSGGAPVIEQKRNQIPSTNVPLLAFKCTMFGVIGLKLFDQLLSGALIRLA